MKEKSKAFLSEDKTAMAYSFLIPCFIVLVCYILRGIAPLGPHTLCSMDGFSQYYPMLQNMAQALKKGELFYSFSGALGFNLWAQSAYYTSSPLWLLIYILPDSMRIAGINVLVMLKIALCGLLFCLRLICLYPGRKSRGRLSLFVALSCAWALSGYVLAFINQLMWLDVILLLPLVALGIETLIHRGKSHIYLIALFLTVWTCFYLAYMVCIFSVLYFLYLIFSQKTTAKERFRHCLRFGTASLLAGASAAVLLIPTAKALSLTAASDMGFDRNVEIIYTLKDFLLRFLPFQKISLEYGEPNLYCSLIPLGLMIGYWLFSGADRRKRLLSFLFMSFLFLSMSINFGEFIWHGFHFPNQLPARQSFLSIFLLLSLAAEGINSIRMKKSLCNTLAALMIAGVGLNAVFAFNSENIADLILKNKKGAVCDFIHEHTEQIWASNVSSLRRFDEKMEEFTALDDKDAFVRMEFADEKKNNYPQQYSYNGICYYSSTMSADAYDFFQGLGLPRYARNVSTYYDQSEITNALFGIRYILEKGGESITVNSNALPLAFLSREEVLTFDLSDYEAGAESQTALWNAVRLEEGESFAAECDRLKKSGLLITDFGTDRIEGRIDCERDGVLLTTIPYDGGWKIYIDGHETEVHKAARYLCSAYITAGEHEITMKYTIPGIKAGFAVSLAAMALSVLFLLAENKKKSLKKSGINTMENQP
ncbi:MAG: YfhO family protein [Oscillospiraceae bacterium]|nr:YfhO family protein [Oscillospiraceae bacterium]